MEEDLDQIIGFLNENREMSKQVEKDSALSTKERFIERNTTLLNI